MKAYHITVNKSETQLKKSDADALDIIKTRTDFFHVLKNNKAFEVQQLSTNFLDKTLTLSVNGNPYKVTIADAYDQQVKKMGLHVVASQKVNTIKAPMPGLIVNIMVKEGQEVTEGNPLFVLSAMKMENIILSQADGVIKSIAVQKDDAVEKGQLIIEME